MPGCCGCFITTLARSSTPLAVATIPGDPVAALVWTPTSLHVYDSSVEGGLVRARTCPTPVPLQSSVPVTGTRFFTVDVHGTCSLWDVAGSGVPHQLQSHPLPAPDGSSHAWLPSGVVTSSVQNGQLCICCVTNTVHIINTSSQQGLQVLAASALPCFAPLSAPATDPAEAALLTLQSTWQPYALTWLPQQLQTDVLGRPLLAVLHQYTPPGGIPSVHVDVMVVDWGAAALLPGPWSCRLLHPTSRLLVALEGHPTLPPGLLLINSTGVLLLGDPGPSISSLQATGASSSSSSGGGGAAGGQVGPALLVDWGLPGVPTCCCRVGTRWQWVVGDDMAGLVLLDLTAAPTFMSLTTTSPPSVPSLLVHLPLATPAAAADTTRREGDPASSSGSGDGLLFLGSTTGSSQVLRVPPAVGPALASASTSSATGAQGGAPNQVWPIVQSALLPSMAACSCGVPFSDPSGAWPEQQLLLGAGVAPRGRLVKLRSGVGLQPYLLDGPELPGSVALFAVGAGCTGASVATGGGVGGAADVGGVVAEPPDSAGRHQQQQQDQPEHELLVVSLESSERTLVLSLSGSTFSQLDLPHLDTGAASLLVAGVPATAGGGLVQVTPGGGIRRLGPGPNWELLGSWASPGPLSLAAAHQESLAVATGQTLYSFQLTSTSGLQQTLGQRQLPQQASSLDFLQVPASCCAVPGAPGGGLQGDVAMSDMQAAAEGAAGDPQLLLAAGLWVENRVVLLSWPGLEEVGAVDLEGQQPRSSSLLQVAGRPVLVVGTATGQVLLWELCPHSDTLPPSSSKAPWRWSVRHSRCVEVTHSSITLQRLRLPLAGSNSSRGLPLQQQGQQQRLVEGVWAQGAAGALLCADPDAHLLLRELHPDTPSSSSSSHCPLAVTDLVRVSRVCGSDGVVSLVGVHTATMPHSLAYVAANTRLCFGGLDPEHRLRWVVAPVRDTVEAMVVHEPTGCVVALTAASDGAQSLRVLEATRLKQLLCIRLAAGHYYSSLACVDLPCSNSTAAPAAAAGGYTQPHPAPSSSSGGAAAAITSSSSSGAAGRPHIVTRPFLVLGSYLLLPQHTHMPAPLGTDPPHHKHARQGMLTFFDLVKVAGVEGAGYGSSVSSGAGGAAMGSRTHVHYELRHLNTVALEPGCLPSCLGAARPHWVAPRAAEQPAPSNSRPQGTGSKVGRGGAGTTAAAAAELDAALASRNAAADAVAQQYAAEVEAEACGRGWVGWTTRVCGGAAATLPLLLVGGERGVQAYHVWIDAQQQTLQQQAQDLVSSAAMVSAAAAGGQPAATGVQQDKDSDGTTPATVAGAPAAPPAPCRCIVQPVAGWAPPAGGCVTQLLVTGRCVVALEALGGASLALLVCSPGGVQLVPVAEGPQHFTTAVAAFSRQQAAGVAQQLAAAAWLGAASGYEGLTALPSASQEGGAECSGGLGTASVAADPVAAPLPEDLHCLLVAGHPQGLQLLQFEPDDLEEALREARAAAAAGVEQGRACRWWDMLGLPVHEMPQRNVLAPYLEEEGVRQALNDVMLQVVRGRVHEVLQHLQEQQLALDQQHMEVDQPSAAAAAAGGGGGGSGGRGPRGSSSGPATLKWGLNGEPTGQLHSSMLEWTWTLEVMRQRSSSSDSNSGEWWRTLLQQAQAGLPYVVPEFARRPRMHTVAAAQPPGVVTLAVPGRLGLHVMPWGQQQEPGQPHQQQQQRGAAAGAGVADPLLSPPPTAAQGGWQGAVVCVTPAGGVVGVQLLPPGASDALGDGPHGLQRNLRAWAQDCQQTAAVPGHQGPCPMDTDVAVPSGMDGPAAAESAVTGSGVCGDASAKAALAGCWGWQDPAAAAAKRRADQAAALQAGGGSGAQGAPGAIPLPEDLPLAMGRCVDGDLLQLLAPSLLEQAGATPAVGVAAGGVHTRQEQLQPAFCLWSLLNAAVN